MQPCSPRIATWGCGIPFRPLGVGGRHSGHLGNYGGRHFGGHFDHSKGGGGHSGQPGPLKPLQQLRGRWGTWATQATLVGDCGHSATTKGGGGTLRPLWATMGGALGKHFGGGGALRGGCTLGGHFGGRVLRLLGWWEL